MHPRWLDKTPQTQGCAQRALRSGIIALAFSAAGAVLISACTHEAPPSPQRETDAQDVGLTTQDSSTAKLTVVHGRRHARIEQTLVRVAQSAADYDAAFPTLGRPWPKLPESLYEAGLPRDIKLARDMSRQTTQGCVVVRPHNSLRDEEARPARIALYWAPHCCPEQACVLRAGGKLEWISMERLREERAADLREFAREIMSCTVSDLD